MSNESPHFDLVLASLADDLAPCYITTHWHLFTTGAPFRCKPIPRVSATVQDYEVLVVCGR